MPSQSSLSPTSLRHENFFADRDLDQNDNDNKRDTIGSDLDRIRIELDSTGPTYPVWIQHLTKPAYVDVVAIIVKKPNENSKNKKASIRLSVLNRHPEAAWEGVLKFDHFGESWLGTEETRSRGGRKDIEADRLGVLVGCGVVVGRCGECRGPLDVP
jgi:hypothetical protein